jgi:hypothetical protein
MKASKMKLWGLGLCVSMIGFSSLANAAIQMLGHVSRGAGCPEGSVQVMWDPGFTSFTVLYDRLLLEAGRGRGAAGRVNCEVEMILKKHQLQGFAVEAVDLRGFVQLDPGVRAQQLVSVSSGSTRELRVISTDFGAQRWQGPIAQNYTISTLRPSRRPEILNCIPFREKTRLVIRTQMDIAGASGGSGGMMAVDSADGRVMQRYHVRWQNCVETTKDLIEDLIGRLGRR